MTYLSANFCTADGDQTNPDVIAEHAQIETAVHNEKSLDSNTSWFALIRPGPNLRRFTMALYLPAVQQFTGINAITYCK